MQKSENVKTPKKQNTGFILLVILLLTIIIVLSSIGLYAWAKYQSKIAGSAAAQVAKWNFELIDGDTQTTDIIDFPVTRTDTNTTVENNRVAPGTYGQFEIGIDTTGTEVTMEYNIKVELTNCPKNLIFYADAGKTQVLDKTGDILNISKYLSLEEVDGIHTEIIYWDWAYESMLDTNGDGVATKEEGDAQDTIDQGKKVTMKITVKGTQVLEEPVETQSLADVASIGDTVIYNAGTATIDNTQIPEGVTLSGTISASDTKEWLVLDKIGDTVVLMAKKPTTQTIKFTEVNGYNNSITALNSIASIYLNTNYATNARSLTVDDINTVENHTPNGAISTKNCTTKYSVDEDLNIIDNGTIGTYTFSTTKDTGYYIYSITSELFKGKTCWLASRCLSLDNNDVTFFLRLLGNTGVYCSNIYAISGAKNEASLAFCPVVTLKMNIQTTGQNESGAWELVSKN